MIYPNAIHLLEEIMKKESFDPQLHLPLTPAKLHILLALSQGERHGYAIMQEVEAQTNGQFKLGPGTLYGTIKRMLADGWIEEAGERPDPALDDERRRYYRLTNIGSRVTTAEIERLAQLVQRARSAQIWGDLSPSADAKGG
jgi:DNA-binding PadR family transcriptional regulator